MIHMRPTDVLLDAIAHIDLVEVIAWVDAEVSIWQTEAMDAGEKHVNYVLEHVLQVGLNEVLKDRKFNSK